MQNLRAYQIDARYHLRDRVLYLNAGIHLDKVMVAVLVHKEFQRSGVDIAYVPGNLHCVVTQRLPHLRCDGESRGEFHYFLIAPLQRAITLVKMHHIAVFIAQHLKSRCA